MMDVELAQFLDDAGGLKKAKSFENLVLFALNLSAGAESSAENTKSSTDEVPANIIQESDHEVRLASVTGAMLEATGINNCLYRALTCSEIKEMFSSSMSIFNKVLTSNNSVEVPCKMNVRTYRGGCAMLVDEELDLDDESKPVWKNFVNAEVDSIVPRSNEDDTTTVKHVMITDDLKFYCKLCGVYTVIYKDLFLHLNSVLHHVLTLKEERRLDFVYHKNLLLKVKQVRELLAEEGDDIAILQGESYNCKLCDKCFSSEVDVFVHVTSLKHQQLKVRTKKTRNFSKGIGGLLARNRMLRYGAIWQCSVCDGSAMTLAEAVMHVKKEAHKENLVRKHEQESCRRDLQLAKQKSFSADSSSVQSKEVQMCEKDIPSEDLRNGKEIQMCSQHFVGEDGTVGELSENALQLATKEENEILQNKIFQEEYKYLLYVGKGIFFCKLCTSFVSACGVDYHVYNRFHTQTLEEKTIALSRLWFTVRLLEQGDFGNVAMDAVDPSLFECRLCKARCLEMEDVLLHVASEAHATNLRPGLVQYRKLSAGTLMCRLCHTVVQSEEYLTHVHSESHQVEFSKHVSRLELKQKQQKLFCKLPDILRRHEEFFRPVSGTTTRCMLCKSDMTLAADDVWAHINDSYHVSHMNYHLQKMLCNFEIVDEDKIVENQNRILETALDVTKNDANGILNKSDFLQTDSPRDTHPMDNEENAHHFSIDRDSILYSKLGVIPQKLREMLSSEKNFDEHCAQLCGLSDNDFLETQNSQIISMLEQTFRPVFPECTAVVFGSRMAGFALHNNDVDVYIDVGSSKLRSHDHHMSQRLFVRMGYRLMSSRQDCRNLKDVPYARTPIIRFTYIPLGIDCDLNFMNEMSVQNTKLVRFYSTLDERVKMLILLVRHWAKTTGATRLGTLAKISNYALTLLVIFYLQQLYEPVVPTVEFLQSTHVGEKKFIRGWNCSFVLDESAIPRSYNTSSTAKLLHDFFQFCARVDFGHVVLCPQCGKSMSRRAFVQWMGRQRTQDSQWEKFRIKSPMCVQDPLDLSHNVTKGVTSKCLASFQLFCQTSANLARKLCGD